MAFAGNLLVHSQPKDLTSGDIPALVRSLAIPASIGFFFQTMYNVVDTYWAGVLSTEAQAALALSFPVFFIILAIGSGIATATTVLISHSLGAKKKQAAGQYAGQGLSFALAASILLTIAGLFASPFLFTLLGASSTYLESSLAYMDVILLGTVFFMLSFTLNSFLSSQGDTKSFRNALIVGFFLNVILDPLFMFGYGPVPRMGVAGLAWATVLIQFLTVIYMGHRVRLSGMLGALTIADYRPRLRFYIEIARQGIPASLNMLTVAVGIFVITYYVSQFGKEAVAAYGIATRVEQIMLLPTIGLNIAALTLIGHNYGARQFGRVKEIYAVCMKYGLGLMAIGLVVLFLFAGHFMRLFTSDESVISIAVPYLHIAAFVFWAYVIMFLTTALLQGLKRPMFAVYIGIYRQIIAPIILFWLLSVYLGLGIGGIWYGVFLVNWSATAISLWYAHSVLKKVHL